jgi:hypothetical protein
LSLARAISDRRFRAAGFCVARPCGRTQISQVFAK